MKYLTFFASLVLMLILVSCDNGRPADTTSTTETTPVPTNSTAQPQSVDANVDANKTSTTTTKTILPETTIPTAPVIPRGTATAGLNPAHGQPGHRCDIAVGAPLNSSPVQQPVTPTTTTTTTPATFPTNQVVESKATTAVAAGMNPAHGQPGHRCDIAVGAPLNSKPIQQPVATITTPGTDPKSQVVEPKATTTVATGMNPAHGQPGHRCDIPVGSPLNSKPTQPSVTTQTTINTQAAPSITPIKPSADTSRQKQ